MPHPDVIIVGAGLAGCSVGWHLAPHRRLLLLEQAPGPGMEATAQNAGMVRRMGEDPYERALALRTVSRLEQLPSEDWPEAPSRVTGALIGLAHDPHHLHDAVAHLRAAGVRVEACDRPGEVAPAMQGSPLERAWYLPDERVADAHGLLQGFLRGIRWHRGELRCGVEVRSLVVEGDRVTGVETDQGRIPGGQVVLAAGAWSSRLVPGLSRPLFPLRRTLLLAPSHPLSRPDHPWCWVDDVGIYARPEGGGWLVSGCDEALDPPLPGPGSKGPIEEVHRALAMDKLQRYLPALADARLASGWSGLRTFAPDRRPLLGEDPDRPGLWWAAGLGGFGVSCALGIGEAVSCWMLGQQTPWIDRRGISPGRPFLRRWAIRPQGDIHSTRLVDTASLP